MSHSPSIYAVLLSGHIATAERADFLATHRSRNRSFRKWVKGRGGSEPGADNVPATALAAITRTYAKVIDDVNKLGIKEIAAPHRDGP